MWSWESTDPGSADRMRKERIRKDAEWCCARCTETCTLCQGRSIMSQRVTKDSSIKLRDAVREKEALYLDQPTESSRVLLKSLFIQLRWSHQQTLNQVWWSRETKQKLEGHWPHEDWSLMRLQEQSVLSKNPQPRLTEVEVRPIVWLKELPAGSGVNVCSFTDQQLHVGEAPPLYGYM